MRYVAWAFDDLHNYGPPAGDYVLVPIPPQIGRITVNASTGQVVPTVSPSHINLTGHITDPRDFVSQPIETGMAGVM